MKFRKLTVALACALLIGVIAPATGYAAHYNSRSTSADAWWSSWDYSKGEPGPSNATMDWNLSGFTSNGIFKDAGVPLEISKGSMGWASMFSYTPAVGGEPQKWTEFTAMAEPPSVLSFGKSLTTAQMEYLAEGTMNVWEGTEPWTQAGEGEWELRDPDESTTEMVSVIASWKATGALARSTNIMRERSADSYWAARDNQSYRKASVKASIVGASGTVYLQSDSSGVWDARITESKSNGRFRGDMMLP